MFVVNITAAPSFVASVHFYHTTQCHKPDACILQAKAGFKLFFKKNENNIVIEES
jgi:hypothetical protein